MFFQVTHLKHVEIRGMNKSVFISRDLSPNSPFKEQLTTEGFRIMGRSLLEFKPVPFDAFPTTDWIFFYSRKAVEFFLAQMENLPTDVKIAAYGKGTHEALSARNIQPDFTGTGVGDSTLAAFLKVAKQATVLFPQARHSRRTIERLAGDQLISFPIIVYDNFPKAEVKASASTFLVFTSPLNVSAYFEQNSLARHQKVIAIGETTAEALNNYEIADFTIARTPSEEGLATAVLKLTILK